MTTQTIEGKRSVSIIRHSTGIAHLLFDAAGKFNSMGSSTLEDLRAALDEVEADKSIKAAVAYSGKVDSFVIGADLYEIRKASSEEELLKLSRNGQTLLNRIATFPKPFVVAIHGACLGGGLEIALACHRRVASKSEKTILGLPETKLGLIPGLGGTQRLPRLVGLKAALDMILSANPISATQAKEIGLIDLLAENEQVLLEEADKVAAGLIDSAQWKELMRKNHEDLSASSTQIKAGPFCLTELSSEKAEKMLAISERAIKVRSKGHYPAPLEAIRAIRTGLQNGLTEGLALESQSFATLANGDVSANLISLFFNSDLAKGASQALVQKFAPAPVQTVGVIGAGAMGCSIAELAATHGIKAKLKTDPAKFPAVQEIMQQLAQRSAMHKPGSKLESEQEKKESIEKILNNIELVGDFEQLAGADIIIECIIEDTQIKLETLKKLEAAVGENCIIASNTSALSITELSQASSRPQNFLGVHFFNPVDRMPLVELISHTGTNKAALARATDLVLRMEKTPLVLKDKPGFLINRLLTVYLFEIARLAEEQTPINWVEDAMLEFGMPVGPLQLMDEIGIDVAFTVAKNLEKGLGARLQSPKIFERVCAMGMPGKKGNYGFYLWENQEKRLEINPEMLEKIGAIVSADKPDAQEKQRITYRMVLPMLDEAARCLEERVVPKAREIDFALILGVGFPAFRGGLLKYADQQGLPKLVKELQKMYAHTQSTGSAGERTVSPLLLKYASEGRGFYSLAGAREE